MKKIKECGRDYEETVFTKLLEMRSNYYNQCKVSMDEFIEEMSELFEYICENPLNTSNALTVEGRKIDDCKLLYLTRLTGNDSKTLTFLFIDNKRHYFYHYDFKNDIIEKMLNVLRFSNIDTIFREFPKEINVVDNEYYWSENLGISVNNSFFNSLNLLHHNLEYYQRFNRL